MVRGMLTGTGASGISVTRISQTLARAQDFLTSSFLLTSKDRFYSRAQMGQLACQMGDALNSVELPQPALLKPLELWTGKQVFSMLVRPSSRARWAFISLWPPSAD